MHPHPPRGCPGKQMCQWPRQSLPKLTWRPVPDLMNLAPDYSTILLACRSMVGKTDLKPTTQRICFASQRASHFPLAICEKKKPLKGTTKPSKTFKNQIQTIRSFQVPVSPQLWQVEEPPIQTVQTLPTATEAPRQGLARGFLCNRQEHSWAKWWN